MADLRDDKPFVRGRLCKKSMSRGGVRGAEEEQREVEELEGE